MVATAMSSPPPPPPHSATSDEFGYSQKLFHIANGKVYGVFSPLHGRQALPRGPPASKKKGLKFHNFLPAEGDSRTDAQWPSEFCLREEHGTKQILVSNFPLVAKSPESILSSETMLPLEESQPTSAQTGSSSEMKEEEETPAAGETSCDQPATHRSTVPIVRRHRRKPLQTNRIVPYGKYLSLMTEEPLDLSMPSSDCLESSPVESFPSTSQDDLVSERGELFSLLQPTLNIEPETIRCSPVPLVRNYGNHSRKSVRRREQATRQPQTPGVQQQPCSSLQAAMPNLNHLLQQHPGPTGQDSLMTSFKLPWARGRARQSGGGGAGGRRTVIKKRLEDTFRDNGFLVKTKQVSDGDATFCKFRQLRKYTRYYLKSWHHHLPDEVNKLWKGFLPPKSNLPSSSAASSFPSTSTSSSLPPPL